MNLYLLHQHKKLKFTRFKFEFPAACCNAVEIPLSGAARDEFK
jgi:hypothetical protein